jgi:rhodanese-related sulfurtransferase
MSVDISVQELKERLDKGEKIIIIDVREPYEYEEYNIGAQLIPLGDLQGHIDDFEEMKNEEIVVHCRSGARSAAAKGFMVQNGYTNVRNLIGGIMAYAELK